MTTGSALDPDAETFRPVIVGAERAPRAAGRSSPLHPAIPPRWLGATLLIVQAASSDAVRG